MEADSLQVEDLLTRIHLFQGLDNDQIAALARRLERVRLQPNERLYSQGDVGDSLFIVFQGQVRVSRAQDGELMQLGVLTRGDYFGEEALLYAEPRSASVSAFTPAVLLCLTTELATQLAEAAPQFEANLLATAESRQLAQRMRFDWLSSGEVIQLVARKHIARLWLALAGPVVVALFSLPFFILAYLTAITTPLLVGAILFLIALLWGLWNGVDWGNDYYIVTNQRVIWLERVFGLYDSREEAPLRTVLSVDVQSDQIGRILGYGDVIVRTYTGRIVMRNVGRPRQLGSLVEQSWMRSRLHSQEAEAEAMERALRQHLDLPDVAPAEVAPEPTSEPPSPDQPDSEREVEVKEPVVAQDGFLDLMLANFFRLRYEEGSVITYRKHWFILLQTIWLPSLLVLGTLAAMIARVFGSLRPFSSLTVFVVGIASLTVLAAWWLYVFIDWRNDIYQVTADHIVDIDRKPLGTEQKRSAPLENILSLENERVGILGLILNFGNVRVRIGTDEFTFDGVHDPAQVQQDVFAHMDERLRQKREAEAARERERIAEWLATYHRTYGDYLRGEGNEEGV